jgi:hypothetical protein
MEREAAICINGDEHIYIFIHYTPNSRWHNFLTIARYLLSKLLPNEELHRKITGWYHEPI